MSCGGGRVGRYRTLPPANCRHVVSSERAALPTVFAQRRAVPYMAQRVSQLFTHMFPLPEQFTRHRCWHAVCAMAESGIAMMDPTATAKISLDMIVSRSKRMSATGRLELAA
jgi:hypothetical protein